ADRGGHEAGDAQDLHARPRQGGGGDRNGIGDDDVLDRALLDAGDGGAAEHRVGSAGEHAAGAVLHHGLGGLDQGAGGVNDVVEDDGGAPLDIADDVHDFADVHGDAALVHDGERGIELLGEEAGALDAAGVGGDDGQIGELHAAEAVHQHGRGEEVIHGDVEEALDLGRVQIHQQGAMGAGGGEQVGDQLGGDRHPGLVLAVLAGVAEVGDDGSDAPRRGALERVNHQQQLHQMDIHRVAGGLDDEDVGAADVLENLDIILAVAEAGEAALAGLDAEVLADLAGERGVGGAAEDLELVIEAAFARGTGRLRELALGGGAAALGLFQFDGAGGHGLHSN